MFRKLILATFAAVSFSVPVAGDTLTIGAWNIQDLHHEEGVHLRDFGGITTVKRDTEDFALLEKYRDLFGRAGKPADVIALQEIGTKAGLEKLFPASEYTTIMSPRWQDDNAAPGEGDVYTAIAVRRNSGVSIVDNSAHATGLEVLHVDGNPTRAGTGTVLEFAGQEFAFLSVHLKSSCNKTLDIHRSPPNDCGTLWLQTPALRAWIESMQTRGLPVIIAGDFNRRFREMNFEGSLWETINGVDPTTENGVIDPNFAAHPETTPRLCSTKKGRSNQPIDWVMVGRELADKVVTGSYWERRWSDDDKTAAQGGRGLSDHCPISIQLDFE